MLNGKRIIVVLPAYNASRTLEATVRELPDIVDERILVDDCSSDETAAMARRLGLTVHVHPANRGYGANQKTCYRVRARQAGSVPGADFPVCGAGLAPPLRGCVAPLIPGIPIFPSGSPCARQDLNFGRSANPVTMYGLLWIRRETTCRKQPRGANLGKRAPLRLPGPRQSAQDARGSWPFFLRRLRLLFTPERANSDSSRWMTGSTWPTTATWPRV